MGSYVTSVSGGCPAQGPAQGAGGGVRGHATHHITLATAMQCDRNRCRSSKAMEEPWSLRVHPVPAVWQGARVCATAKGSSMTFNAIPPPLFGDNPKEQYGCTAP